MVGLNASCVRYRYAIVLITTLNHRHKAAKPRGTTFSLTEITGNQGFTQRDDPTTRSRHSRTSDDLGHHGLRNGDRVRYVGSMGFVRSREVELDIDTMNCGVEETFDENGSVYDRKRGGEEEEAKGRLEKLDGAV